MYNRKHDFFIYVFSSLLYKIVLAVSAVLLARLLNKEDFGFLRAILSFTGLVGVFVNFGLNDLLLYKVSKIGGLIGGLSVFSRIIPNYLLLYILYLPLSLALYLFLYSESVVFLLIFYFKMLFDWTADSIIRSLQAVAKYKLVSLLLIVNSSFLAVPVLCLYVLDGGLRTYVFYLFIASLAYFLLNLLTFIFKNKSKPFYLPHKPNLNLFRESIPFFLSGLMSYIYMQSDILMLSFIKGNVEVARYSAAATIIFTAYYIPMVLYNYFLPGLTHNYKERSKYIYTLNRFALSTLLFVLPIFIPLFLFSEMIIGLIFTYKYIDASSVLKMLSVVFLLHSFCFITGAMLTSSGNQALRTNLQVIVALTNIGLNLIFIPLYGAEGAAFTTMITEIILFALYLYFGIKVVKFSKGSLA